MQLASCTFCQPYSNPLPKCTTNIPLHGTCGVHPIHRCLYGIADNKAETGTQLHQQRFQLLPHVPLGDFGGHLDRQAAGRFPALVREVHIGDPLPHKSLCAVGRENKTTYRRPNSGESKAYETTSTTTNSIKQKQQSDVAMKQCRTTKPRMRASVA